MTWQPQPEELPEGSSPRNLVPLWIRALSQLAFKIALIAFVFLILGAASYWVRASRYDMSAIHKMPERTILLDNQGEELAAIHGQRRRLIKYDEIPKHLVQALLTREDKNFYHHIGVDLRGVLRATLRNFRDQQLTQGASTITMQLARNTFELRARSLDRKFLELAVAFRVEAHYSKNEILTAYLNRIYFGSGAFGIEQAAQTYFAKKTQTLTLPESALIVGIIRAPHAFSPLNSPQSALRERNDVLQSMVRDGFLTKEKKNQHLLKPLELAPPQQPHTDAIRCVRRHLNELLDHHHFRAGGLTATSTIDSRLQNASRSGLDTLLQKHPHLQAALVGIEPSTGAIRTIITARDPKSSQFNRAFDTRRQLGNVFQPFIYAFAAERGLLPIPNQPIQTARQIKEGDLERLARRLGLTGPFPDKANKTTFAQEFAQGNLQATPLEVATALATLCHQGTKPESYLIESLHNAQAEPYFIQEHASRPTLDPFAAQTPFKMKAQPVWSSLTPTKKDLWSLHGTADLAVVLWLGYDQPKTIKNGELLNQRAQIFLKKLTSLAVKTVKNQN